MPELPEVETIRRVLEPQIKGLKIIHITIENSQIISYPAADTFCRLLTGQTISSMSRRGKFLQIHMTSGGRLILHLRMTGCLLVTPPDYPVEKHTHITFHLSSGEELRFSDTRRFGRFWFIQGGETDRYSGIDKLGIEPFDDALNAEYLKTHLGKRKKAIKECLLEQSVLAGIGNIYSDEILFQSRIPPFAPASSLTDEEWERLAAAIPEQLNYFIDRNQITAGQYLAGKGKDYRNTPFLRVYGHADEPCPYCGEKLVRTVIGGRSSIYCPNCQGKPART
jgi:formamidopyrimidine-DNA glycosylase